MAIIKLSNDDNVIIDDDIFSDINKYNWSCTGTSSKNRYAASMINNKLTYMHRLVLELNNIDIFDQVDHINGDKFDNRLKNLRLCTAAENQKNKRIQSNNKTGYKGVSYCNRDKKYIARIKLSKRSIALGNYDTKEDAAKAFDYAARILHKEFAVLNFPNLNSNILDQESIDRLYYFNSHKKIYLLKRLNMYHVKKKSVSNIQGISFRKSTNTFELRIKINGKRYGLGIFDSLEDAKNMLNFANNNIDKVKQFISENKKGIAIKLKKYKQNIEIS